MITHNNFQQYSADRVIKNALSDRQLFEKFKVYGQAALEARNKCIGLLPEINRRRLYLRHGFTSIHEFAAKLAGLSHEQVNRVLNLEPRLRDKPALHEALVKGEVSANKLRKVISIATVENQAEVAATIRGLSVRAVECLVRDAKKADVEQGTQTTGSHNANAGGHVTTQKTIFYDGLQLKPEVEQRLINMQKKGIDINQLLEELLDRHQSEIEAKKGEIATTLPTGAASRYVPARVKSILRQEYGNNCSVPGCRQKAESLHHTRRFTVVPNHDPRFLAPLCRGHHELVHQVDAKVLMHRSGG